MVSLSALAGLRHRIAQIEGTAVGRGLAGPHWPVDGHGPVESVSPAGGKRSFVLDFGVSDIDAAFRSGGLPSGRTHEVAPACPGDGGIALAFALALTVRLAGRLGNGLVVIVQERMA